MAREKNEPKIVPKAICYITREATVLLLERRPDGLLLFPGGTIEFDERPRQAAIREAREEADLSEFLSVRYIGRRDYDMRPVWNEIHRRYFYHLVATDRRLSWTVSDQGSEQCTFVAHWIPFAEGHAATSGLGALLGRLANILDGSGATL